ncbi:MAG: hypothetical protein ABSG59_09285 [Verrucomicrobiota bacterium]|jgi:anti-sigma factor RsiW
MKHHLELKIQAWTDGELSHRQARRVAQWIGREAQAAELAAELAGVKKALAANEPARTVPESRDFYWSKIERQIQRQAQNRPAPSPWYARWQGLLVPLTGVTALVCALAVIHQPRRPTFDEISATDDTMEAVTFNDQTAGMSVVWLQDKNPPVATEQTPPAAGGSTVEEGDPDAEVD